MKYLAAAWHIRKRNEGRVVGEPEELMEEGNIFPLRDCLFVVRGALRPSVEGVPKCVYGGRLFIVLHPCAAHLVPH